MAKSKDGLHYRQTSGIRINTSSIDDLNVKLSKSFTEDEKFSTAIFTEPLSRAQNYFEIEIMDEGIGCLFSVGVGSRTYPFTALPGWITGSFGYHADGNLFIEQGDTPIQVPKCAKGDRMGCGVDFASWMDGHVHIWFTKNEKLVYNPEKIVITESTAFHPLISVGNLGEIAYYKNHNQQNLPDTSNMYPWFRVSGFHSTAEIPFYSSDESLLKYGTHKMTDIEHVDHQDCHLAWDELRDALWEEIPSDIQELGKLTPDTFQEWIHIAESSFQGRQEYIDLTQSQNGCQLENNDRIALFLAQEVLNALVALNSGYKLKVVAILVYLSLGMESEYLNVTVVSGLLYMGCSANSSNKALHVFHNPDISVSLVHLLLNWGGNPNVPDAIGRTPLHIHQNNRALMRTFLSHSADVNALDDERNSPLHYAGINGRNGIVDLLIEHGANAGATFGGQPSSLDVTAAAGKIECFKQMLKLSIKKVTEKKVQQQITEFKWRDAVSELPKWKKIKHKSIDDMTREEFFYVTVKQHDYDKRSKFSLRKLVTVAEENEVDLQAEIFSSLFDHCLYGQTMVIADILDADINGDVDSHVKDEDKGASLLGYLSKRPSLLISLVSHDTLKAYITDQWRRKALGIFTIRIIFYLFQLILLTFALAVAARPGLPDTELNTYSTPIDIARGVCEGFILLLTVLKLIDETLEILLFGLFAYISDVNNCILWLSILFILMIVPFRVIGHPGQWIVATLAYFMFGMRSYYLVSLFNLTGTYIQTLVIIISRDIVKFLAMFCVVLMIFSGTFLLSLRYDSAVLLTTLSLTVNTTPSMVFSENTATYSAKHGGGSMEESPTEAFIYGIYYTGLRILIESGSVINYYEDGVKMGILSIIIYLLFLFIIVTILLNVLIAQVSDTYAKVLEKAEGHKLFKQCLYVARLEKRKYAKCVLKIPCFHILYQFCCGLKSRKQSLIDKQGREILSVWNRPRILVTGHTPGMTTSIAQAVSRSFTKMITNYLPDTMSAKTASNQISTENLEMKIDGSIQKLKEMEEQMRLLMTKQEKRFSQLIEAVQTSVLTGFNAQTQKIKTDIKLSEDQEMLMTKFFITLEDFRSETASHNLVMKQRHESEQRTLEERFKEVFSQQQRLKEHILQEKEELQHEMLQLHRAVTAQLIEQDDAMKISMAQQEDRIRVELEAQQNELEMLSQQYRDSKELSAEQHSQLSSKMSQQQEDVRGQLVKQEEKLHKAMSCHHNALEKELINQQEQLTELSQLHQELRKELRDKHLELDAKISRNQDDIRDQIVKQERDLKRDLELLQEKLCTLMSKQQEDIHTLSKENAQARDFLTLKHNILETKFDQQQQGIQQQVAKQHQELMSEFPSQWEALSKLIIESVSSTVRGEMAPSKKK